MSRRNKKPKICRACGASWVGRVVDGVCPACAAKAWDKRQEAGRAFAAEAKRRGMSVTALTLESHAEMIQDLQEAALKILFGTPTPFKSLLPRGKKGP